MAIFPLATARLLDSRAHTAQHSLLHQIGPVQTALGSYHCCTLSPACPSEHRHTLHQCVVAERHLPHTRPLDVCIASPDLLETLTAVLSCAVPGGSQHRLYSLEKKFGVGWIWVITTPSQTTSLVGPATCVLRLPSSGGPHDLEGISPDPPADFHLLWLLSFLGRAYREPFHRYLFRLCYLVCM